LAALVLRESLWEGKGGLVSWMLPSRVMMRSADTGMIGAGCFLSVCVEALTYILRPVTIVTIAYVSLVLCFYQSEDWGEIAPSSG